MDSSARAIKLAELNAAANGVTNTEFKLTDVQHANILQRGQVIDKRGRLAAATSAFEAVAGEDSLQALMLALEFLQTMLPTVARRKREVNPWAATIKRRICASEACKGV